MVYFIRCTKYSLLPYFRNKLYPKRSYKMSSELEETKKFNLLHGILGFCLAVGTVMFGIYLGRNGFPEFASIIGCGIAAAIVVFFVKKTILKAGMRYK